MKHNTFEPCKDHENGHFGWCLLCEIASLRDSIKNLQEKNDNQREIIESQKENINIINKENRVLRGRINYVIESNDKSQLIGFLETIQKIESGNG